jgi:hypothetical protein
MGHFRPIGPAADQRFCFAQQIGEQRIERTASLT